jgi:PST family polysaccharide transporter
MFNKIQSFIAQTEERKKLVSNIFSLGVLQVASYVLPLLTVPYLVRILGPEYFGLTSFATATIMYFILITEYGFNLTTTQQISINRNDKTKLSQIFSSVMIIKIVLTFICFILMTILVFSFEKFSKHWEVYFISYGIVIGQVLFPIWLFQGLEQMKYITFINIGSKIFFTICIFIFIHTKSDYMYVPLLNSLGYLVAGIWSLFLVRKKFKINFTWQNISILKATLLEGWHIFYSSLAVSIYTISTTFILGLFTNNTVVGYYAGADKIVQAVKGLYQPIATAIYPLISKKMNDDKKAGLNFIKIIIKYVCGYMSAISFVLFFFAEPIVHLLLGRQYQQSIVILKIMAFLPLIVSMSNIYGIQIMLNLGYKKMFSRIISIAAFLAIVLSLLLVPLYAALGTAITLLIVELFVTFAMYYYVQVKILK